MILLDTTVLVYAVGREHPLAHAARQLMVGVREGIMRASTTPEVIQEFAHVRARRTSRSEAADMAEAYATALAPLQTVSAQHLTTGLNLWRAVSDLGSFDAVLAATALALDAQLVSADQAFGDVPNLHWTDLGAFFD